MAEQQLIGALEAGGTKMVCATGYADGTVLEREQIATTTPQETVEAVNAWFADKGIAALGIGGGVADHTPIVPLARKKCAEMLNGYIVTPEVNDIDSYIVNNSLEGKQGIMGCLALGAQALQ